MPDKTYVHVDDVEMTVAFGHNYKNIVPKCIMGGIIQAINRSSKLTTKEPSDRNAEGFYVAPNMTLTRTDQGVEAELKVLLAGWPKKKMLNQKSSKASTAVPNPGKLDQKVNEVVETVLEHIQASVVKDLEGRVK